MTSRVSMSEREVIELFFAEMLEEEKPPIPPGNSEMANEVVVLSPSQREYAIIEAYNKVINSFSYIVDPKVHVMSMIETQKGSRFPENEVIKRLKEELGL